ATIACLVTFLLVIKMSLDYKTTKLQAKNGPDNSLGKDELRLLIQEAVEQGTAPLHRRITELEGRAVGESLIGIQSGEPSRQLNPANGAEPNPNLQA
ncbi:MAG TPA: hypothetical protein VFG50_01785, partial [Rhodothermales bacterium]|nr:hypothetical protein [Rhodothermales bacterium]